MMHRALTTGLGMSVLVFSLVGSLVGVSAGTAEKVDAEINAKIRKEGMDNSRIMRTLHYLTDVYGPRLTGSPNLKAAGEWVVKESASWGFTNGHLEPWDWGKPGWTNDFASVVVTSPFKDKLEFEVLAWTPGTKGQVKASAYNLVAPEQPTKEALEAYLTSGKSQVQHAA